MSITVADIDEIRRELGPIVAEAVREHAADVDALAREAVRARLADREYLDTDACAAYLGIAARTVRQYRKAGAFGDVYERFSKLYVRRTAVDAYLASGVSPAVCSGGGDDGGGGEGGPDRLPAGRGAVSSPIASPETTKGTKPASTA